MEKTMVGTDKPSSSSSSSFLSGTGTGTGTGTNEEKMRNKTICVCLSRYDDTRALEVGIFPLSDADFKYDRIPIEVQLDRLKRRRCCPSSDYQVIDHICDCGIPNHSHEKDPVGMGMINIISPFHSPSSKLSGLTILGSTIYSFGSPIDGVPRFYSSGFNNAYKFDISRRSSCPDGDDGGEWNWKPIPSMSVSRQSPLAVTVDQKIYVFGGISLPRRSMWAEVFDTTTSQWELLPPPPKSALKYIINSCTLVPFLAVLNHPKRILLGSPNGGDFCTYMVEDSCWDEFEISDRIPGYGRRADFGFGLAAVYGQTLYWFVEHYNLVAYDVDNKLWLRAPVHGLSDAICFAYASSSHQLVHVCDDLFCLLWTSHERTIPYDMNDRSNTNRIHCAKLRVSISQNSLNAFLESCQSYISDHDVDFSAGWLMDGIFAE